MLIDWFTVGAQVFNFVVLVWLLKRFLYAPVLATIDARDQKIAAQLNEAAAQTQQAHQAGQAFQARSQLLEDQRQALWEGAVSQAAAEKQRLLTAAREQAEAVGVRLRQAAEQAQQSQQQNIRQQLEREVVDVAGNLLKELAGDELQPRIVQVFLDRFRQLPLAEKQLLQGGAQLSSAAPLSPTEQRALSEAIGDVRFQVRPELISGLELSNNGHKLAWSVSEYFAALTKSVD